MKILKFRVYSPTEKKLLYPDFISLGWDSMVIVSGNTYYQKRIENPVIQQCTGFLDQNKKEVYEGDILKYCSEAGEFFYILRFGKFWSAQNNGVYIGEKAPHCEYGIGFHLESLNKDNKGQVCSIWTAYDPFSQDEVMGNIYENIELLK